MLEQKGTLLKLNVKSNRLNLSGNWYEMDSTLNMNADLQGKQLKIQLNDAQVVTGFTSQTTKERDAKGKMQSLNLTIPRFSMHHEGTLTHFYITPLHYAKIKANFKPGDYIQFTYNEDPVMIKGSPCFVLTSLVSKQEKPKNKTLHKLKKEVLTQITQLESQDYYAFLDLEFTMSGAEFRGIKFIPEILQFGVIVTNKEGAIVEKFSSYVQPTKYKRLSGLTQDFLKIDNHRLQHAMTYQQFYDCMKDIKSHYQPLFLVWGVSDAYILQSSYLINEVPPLLEPTQLFDLQRLHRQYFQISQDIGLFNALRAYGMDEGIQIHDAIVDSLVLYRIFFKFKSTLHVEEPFPFKANYMTIVKPKETEA